MSDYGVAFDIQHQERYDRIQMLIRILVLIIVSAVLNFLGWVLYLGIPVYAAILVSQQGAQRYLAEHEQNMTRWLRLLMALWAYLLIMTDRLPNEEPKETLRYDVAPRGEPSAGAVLLRIILAIPHWFVLALLSIVVGVLWIVAAIMVLIQEKYPEGIFTFQRGYMRWVARVYAYMAGLIQDYPPFAFDTGPELDSATAQAALPPQPPPPPAAPPPEGPAPVS